MSLIDTSLNNVIYMTERLLAFQIDDVESLNNVLLIGMTNRKDLLDEALLRCFLHSVI